MVGGTPLTPLTADVLDGLRQVSTSMLATQMYRRGKGIRC